MQPIEQPNLFLKDVHYVQILNAENPRKYMVASSGTDFFGNCSFFSDLFLVEDGNYISLPSHRLTRDHQLLYTDPNFILSANKETRAWVDYCPEGLSIRGGGTASCERREFYDQKPVVEYIVLNRYDVYAINYDGLFKFRVPDFNVNVLDSRLPSEYGSGVKHLLILV